MSSVRLDNAIKYLNLWARERKFGKLIISFTSGTITSIRYENVMTDEQVLSELGNNKNVDKIKNM